MSKKDICIFTLAKNESYFLPKWIKYYNKFFDKNDMYVLDDNSTDGSTTNIDVNVIKVTSDLKIASGSKMTDIVVHYFAKLLESYRYVFYVDIDEFVVPTPSPNLMDHLIKHMINNRNCFIATGYELMYSKEKDGDAAFDINKNILEQRSYAFPSYEYSKPVCANYSLHLNSGQHAAANEQRYSNTLRSDPELILIHTKRFDPHYTLQRHINVLKNYESTTHAPSQLILNKDYDAFVNLHFYDALKHTMLIPLRGLFNYDIHTLF
jgi:hypothetical protein